MEQTKELENRNLKTLKNTRVLALVGVMTAVTCILGPLSIPIGAVPISLTNLAIFFSVYVLGMKLGTISCVMYLLIGMAGLPVFSAFTGGLGKMLGPTGGYMLGYVFMSLICGFFIDRFMSNRALCFLGMILGQAACYLPGTVWLAYQAKLTFEAALLTGVVPFILGDLLKMAFAVMIGSRLRMALHKAGLNR